MILPASSTNDTFMNEYDYLNSRKFGNEGYYVCELCGKSYTRRNVQFLVTRMF